MSRRALLAALALAGCRHSDPKASTLHVAAASNLMEVFREIAKRFTALTGTPVTFSFGSTAQLAKQCEDGAPYDLFAAADNEHVTALGGKGVLLPSTCAVYARGRLALWIPNPEIGVNVIADLARPDVRVISIASPKSAPYGRAAVETLKALNLWARVEPKVVYGTSISMAKQYAASGNADAAFTAYSLVLRERGTILPINEQLHGRIEQSLGILKSSPHLAEANRFRDFLLGKDGRKQLAMLGYLLPEARS
ncbi:MAG: molybdate ABC transporter substrate-binding protein [Acidobacteria bacterium]|nr:molybdate ABC transporter substrate-binding protein [Acidobacteriota bacterium]